MFNGGKRRGQPRDARGRMISQTSSFLTWALAKERRLPRIPAHRVDRGGFRRLIKSPRGRAIAEGWWASVLDGAWPGR